VPAIKRTDEYNRSYYAPLKWHDKNWVESFILMLVSISKFLGIPAAMIEIHPGDTNNSYENIVTSIKMLLNRYHDEFGVEPSILIENRTGQFISSGKDILNFWNYLSRNNAYLKRKVGIVLDIQQLYTVTRKNFMREYEMIPIEAIKAFHIHYRHRVPSLSNEIPWEQIFRSITRTMGNIIINPEVHHKNWVKDAIDFCEGLLRG